MSGIAGIYHRDGAPAAPSSVRQMVNILAHRGPDGANVWHSGPIGFGHRLLGTAPESLQERLPYLNTRGDLAITADARIDNRNELVHLLDIEERDQRTMPDSRLILAAYEKWGQHCPQYLLGAFAFLIWDKRRKLIFAARDHIGIKPFYYFLSNRNFAAASEIKALLHLPFVPREINEERVADFLLNIADDTAVTFYQHIFRLPPAHWMRIGPDQHHLHCYWTLDPSREIVLGTDEAYAEAFRELFTEAVRCRMDSAYPVGSLLSGGLDSSSITCVAQQIHLENGEELWPTYSTLYEEVPSCDERDYINIILAQGGFEPHYAPGDQVDLIDDMCQMMRYQDEPFFAPNLLSGLDLYGQAARHGVRILLDGFDGDTVVSHGQSYISELAIAGRWLELFKNLRGLSQTHGEPYLRVLLALLWSYRLRPLSHRIPRLKGMLEFVQQTWTRQDGSPGSEKAPVLALANSDFASRVNLAERIQAAHGRAKSFRTERERHYHHLSEGFSALALEVMDKQSAAHSLEIRYPFWDKRLVEFCLALPPNQKLDDGWSRAVLRRAMDGIVPAEIQWRPGKTDFAPNLFRTLRIANELRSDFKTIALAGPTVDFLQPTAVQETYQRFLTQGDRGSAYVIWRVVSLASWLSTVKVTRAVTPKSGLIEGGDVYGAIEREEAFRSSRANCPR